MTQVNLSELREKYRGSAIRDLVQSHLQRQDEKTRLLAIQGTIALLPAEMINSLPQFLRSWGSRGSEPGFWVADLAVVLDEVLEEGEDLAIDVGVEPDDEMLFNLFNIVVMTFASAAYGQPNVRRTMGIKDSQRPPLWSTASLLIPVIAFFYVSRTPAPFHTRVGYSLAQLGYVLFVAGMVSGTFLIFRLTKRSQVLIAAGVAFLLGTILSNVVR